MCAVFPWQRPAVFMKENVTMGTISIAMVMNSKELLVTMVTNKDGCHGNRSIFWLSCRFVAMVMFLLQNELSLNIGVLFAIGVCLRLIATIIFIIKVRRN